MKYKVILSDVDGTLIPFKEEFPSLYTQNTIREWQQKGALFVVATGRSHQFAKPAHLGGLNPDYVIGYNGATVVNSAYDLLFSQPMEPHQFQIAEKLGALGYPVSYAFEDGYYIYHQPQAFQDLIQYSAESPHGPACYTDNHQRHLSGMPYTCTCFVPDEVARAFNQEHPEIHLVAYRSGVYDLCQADHNKATGAEKVLQQLGLGWDSVIALGDGGNDVAMLTCSAVGIAMDNAPQFVKDAADHIAENADRDGAAKAIHHFFSL